jgi:hypothetical protein
MAIGITPLANLTAILLLASPVTVALLPMPYTHEKFEGKSAHHI